MSSKYSEPPSIVHAYPSVNQVVGAGISQVVLDLVEFDALDEFDAVTNRFTPRRAGFYHVDYQLEFAVAVLGLSVTAYAQDNIPVVLCSDRINAPAVGVLHWEKGSTIRYLTPNDYVELMINNITPGNATIQTAGARGYTFLSIHRIY